MNENQDNEQKTFENTGQPSQNNLNDNVSDELQSQPSSSSDVLFDNPTTGQPPIPQSLDENVIAPPVVFGAEAAVNKHAKRRMLFIFLVTMIAAGGLIFGMYYYKQSGVSHDVKINSNNSKETSESNEVDIKTQDTEPVAELPNVGLSGNSSGNISSLGLAAKQGDWIFYVKYSVASRKSEDYGLYKVRTDGTGRQQLDGGYIKGINVVGDWVYYGNGDVSDNDINGYYKIKTDGTEKTKLIDGKPSFVNVVDDWIYYFKLSSSDGFEGKIYKIKTDGTEEQEVVSGKCQYVNVVGDWVYYAEDINAIGDDSGIYKVKTDGTQKTKLNNERALSVNVVDSWIYYVKVVNPDGRQFDGNTTFELYKIKNDGIGETKLFGSKSVVVSHVNVSGEYIYFMAGDGVYRIKTNGTEMKKISSESSMYLNIVGDRIYYLAFDSSRDLDSMYRMNIDGTGVESVE